MFMLFGVVLTPLYLAITVILFIVNIPYIVAIRRSRDRTLR